MRSGRQELVGGRKYVRDASATAVRDATAALRAAYDALDASDVDLLNRDQLIDALDELEALSRQLTTQSHRMLARLQVEATPKELGAKSWRDVLAIRWRISTGEAGRRLRRPPSWGRGER